MRCWWMFNLISFLAQSPAAVSRQVSGAVWLFSCWWPWIPATRPAPLLCHSHQHHHHHHPLCHYHHLQKVHRSNGLWLSLPPSFWTCMLQIFLKGLFKKCVNVCRNKIMRKSVGKCKFYPQFETFLQSKGNFCQFYVAERPLEYYKICNTTFCYIRPRMFFCVFDVIHLIIRLSGKTFLANLETPPTLQNENTNINIRHYWLVMGILAESDHSEKKKCL